MRQLIGFAVGAATGAAAALLVTAPEGRVMLERVREETRPDLERAAGELEPIARSVVRGTRLALDDLGIATEGLRAWIAEAAAGGAGAAAGLLEPGAAVAEPSGAEPSATAPATVATGPAAVEPVE